MCDTMFVMWNRMLNQTLAMARHIDYLHMDIQNLGYFFLSFIWKNTYFDLERVCSCKKQHEHQVGKGACLFCCYSIKSLRLWTSMMNQIKWEWNRTLRWCIGYLQLSCTCFKIQKEQLFVSARKCVMTLDYVDILSAPSVLVKKWH